MVNTFYKTLSIYEKKMFDPEMIRFYVNYGRKFRIFIKMFTL